MSPRRANRCPGQLSIHTKVIDSEKGVLYDVEIGGIVEIPGCEEFGIAFVESQRSIVATVDEGKYGIVYGAEYLRQQAGAEGSGGFSDPVLKKTGSPAPRQDTPWKEESGQIEKLPDVIGISQAVGRILRKTENAGVIIITIYFI
ncbi:MAG: hypothetical protein GY703_20730 [Gammaproteobacteria bacterium]|nr:hypothetical protein [Gammaproteobacteria bacterium]